MNFYGVDWLYSALILLSVYLTGKKNRNGFLLGGLSAIIGMGFGIVIGSLASSLCSFVLLVANIWAYRKWDC